MKHSWIILLATFLITCDKSLPDQSIDTNGVYLGYWDTHEAKWIDVLKFNSDSTIISFSTTVDATQEQIRKMVETPPEPTKPDKYRIEGDSIKFTTSSLHGQVIYKGKILPNGKLVLKTNSQITGFISSNIYSFVPFDNSKLDTTANISFAKAGHCN